MKSCIKGKKMTMSISSFRFPSKVKFWKKRSSADLTDVDPSFRAIYLGNVLTGWAKGDGCMDKPLATLWKNHVCTDKPNIIMKVTVCPSGLKAVTKEHGLTEYWANRITCAAADPAYPKVFCWIYRHEGRKLKQELRCHAVLCPSARKARLMAERLMQRLHQALVDFKKEKQWKQNARLSLANSVYDNPTMPNRKIMLQTGSMNYRPPTERGKAAPKLRMVEEVIAEEEEEEEEEEEGGGCKECPIGTPAVVGKKEVFHTMSDPYTRLRRGGKYDVLDNCSSASASTMFTDNLSMTSTVSTVIDSSSALNNDFLIPVVSNEPKPSPRSGIKQPSIARIVPDLGSVSSDEDDDEDQDLVTNYLETLTIDPNVPGEDPSGKRFVSPSNSSAMSEDEIGLAKNELDEDVVVVGNNSKGEQDTISDESGYSEESNATLSSAATASNAYATSSQDHPLHKTEKIQMKREEQGDPTVHGVLISDIEQLKILEKSRQLSGQIQPEFLQKNVPDFCINI